MIPARDKDGWLNVFVETPRGSAAKFKYDERDGVIRLSRPLPAGLSYPYDWGCVPSTRAPDGDDRLAPGACDDDDLDAAGEQHDHRSSLVGLVDERDVRAIGTLDARRPQCVPLLGRQGGEEGLR